MLVTPKRDNIICRRLKREIRDTEINHPKQALIDCGCKSFPASRSDHMALTQDSCLTRQLQAMKAPKRKDGPATTQRTRWKESKANLDGPCSWVGCLQEFDPGENQKGPSTGRPRLQNPDRHKKKKRTRFKATTSRREKEDRTWWRYAKMQKGSIPHH